LNQDPLAGFPVAPAWAGHVGGAGTFLVIGGIVLFVLAALLSILSKRIPFGSKLAVAAFGLGSSALFGAFGCLATLFAKNQFQYKYVFGHGDVHTTLSYKIAGVWSGQQGSFLLWACTSAIFGLLALRGAGKYRGPFLAVYSAFLATLCGILAYETPFGIIAEVVRNGKTFVPPTGQGLAPSLMNYWVVIHPPTIFLGFGSLTVLFAYAVAAMIDGDVRDWVPRVRPWALVSTAILGLGICMGGFWAYETLGWGGFWMWDPVENASFVPWLFLVAFVHGLIVQTARKRWHALNLVFGGLPFLAFAYGTFLTRSGFLENVSVHSFAQMEASALKILEWFMGVVFVGFTGLFLWRGLRLGLAANLESSSETTVNRETLYGSGVLFLSLLAVVLALGMSWPLVSALSGRQVAAVEEGLYHKVVVWFFIPVMLAVAITPFVSWRGLGAREVVRRVANVFSIAVAATGATLLALRLPEWGVSGLSNSHVSMPFGLRMATLPWMAVLLLVCAFALIANLWRLVETLKRAPGSVGGFVAHLGLAVLFTGLIVSRGFERTERMWVRGDQPEKGNLGYTLAFKEMTGKSLYDREGKVLFTVTPPNGEPFTASPGLYYQRAMDGGEDKPMVWPHIQRYAAHDFYLSLGAPILSAWEKPEWFKVGETKTIKDVKVTYRGMEMSGEPGTRSATFGAKLLVVVGNTVVNVTPKFSVASGPDLPLINRDLRVAMTQINAADKSAAIQVFFSSPIYPVEIFTKPLTGFVWAGTGILTLGGLLSAFARRRRKSQDALPDAAVVEEPLIQDAPVPTP
jgi:cytochrome c-type biogenesis protein CcmF